MTYPYSSILADLDYVNENTVGFCYIQNKETGGYITHLGALPIIYGYEEYDYYNDKYEEYLCSNTPVLCEKKLTDPNLSGAQIFRVVALEGGYYAFLNTTRAWYDAYSGSMYFVLGQDRHNLRMSSPSAMNFWYDSWIVEKTASGACRLITRLSDYCTQFTPDDVSNSSNQYLGSYCAYSGRYLGVTKQTTRPPLKNRTFDEPSLFGGYTNDDDYSDEWIFLPVDGYPKFNP